MIKALFIFFGGFYIGRAARDAAPDPISTEEAKLLLTVAHPEIISPLPVADSTPGKNTLAAAWSYHTIDRADLPRILGPNFAARLIADRRFAAFTAEGWESGYRWSDDQQHLLILPQALDALAKSSR